MDLPPPPLEEKAPPPVAVVEVLPDDAATGAVEIAEPVVLNKGKAAYASFALRSLVGEPVTVQLQCDEPAITFQLENENLRHNARESSLPESFNEMFDSIDLITATPLLAGETKRILVCFRPPPAKGPMRVQVNATITVSAVSSEGQQTERVPFRAQVVQSVMDVTASELDFGRCVLNGDLRTKDFVIRNKSDVPLICRLQQGLQKQKGVQVDLLDYDTQEPVLGQDLVIEPYGTFQVQVRLQVAETALGNFTHVLYVENKNDDKTSHMITLHAYIAQAKQEEWLEVRSLRGDLLEALDFGQCYRCNTFPQPFVVKNLTTAVLYVRFGTESRSTDVALDEAVFALPSSGELPALPSETYSSSEGDADTQSRSTVDVSPAGQLMSAPEDLVRVRRVGPPLPIDFLELKPGAKKQVVCWYTPRLRSTKAGAGKADSVECEEWRNHPDTDLEQKHFRVHVEAWKDRTILKAPAADINSIPKQRKSIQETFLTTIAAHATVCTSRIALSKAAINFGDTRLKETKSAVIQAHNESALPAVIDIVLDSQVVKIAETTVTIPPRQSKDITFYIQPFRVNPAYRKQVRFLNRHNPANSLILTIVSNNYDNDIILLHSQYYSLAIPTLPHARSTPAPRVPLATSPKDSKESSRDSVADSLDSSKEGFDDKLEGSEDDPKPAPLPLPAGMGLTSHDHWLLFPRIVVNYPALRSFDLRNTTAQPLTLALSASTSAAAGGMGAECFRLYRQSPRCTPEAAATLRAIVQQMEAELYCTGLPPYDGALKYIGRVMEIRRLLLQFVEDPEEAVLVRCQEVQLEGLGEETVYCVAWFVSPQEAVQYSQRFGTEERERGKLCVDVVLPEKPIPRREIPIFGRLTYSVMELKQKNFNTGRIYTAECIKKNLLITNLSEIPLLYQFHKTGSISSRDLHIEGFAPDEVVAGLIAPFATKDLDFVFTPSLPGKFQETLTIENVLDQTNTQVITVKAVVDKSETFETKPQSLDFGTIELGKRSRGLRFCISNTTKQKRNYYVVVSEDGGHFQFQGAVVKPQFIVEETVTTSTSRSKIEEEIEKCEHKLKICIRKNKVEKSRLIQSRLDKLRRAYNMDGESADVSDSSSISSVSDTDEDFQAPRQHRTVHDASGLSLDIPPNGSATVLVHLNPHPREGAAGPPGRPLLLEAGAGQLEVFESRNKDLRQTIDLAACLVVEDAPRAVAVPPSATAHSGPPAAQAPGPGPGPAASAEPAPPPATTQRVKFVPPAPDPKDEGLPSPTPVEARPREIGRVSRRASSRSSSCSSTTSANSSPDPALGRPGSPWAPLVSAVPQPHTPDNTSGSSQEEDSPHPAERPVGHLTADSPRIWPRFLAPGLRGAEAAKPSHPSTPKVRSTSPHLEGSFGPDPLSLDGDTDVPAASTSTSAPQPPASNSGSLAGSSPSLTFTPQSASPLTPGTPVGGAAWPLAFTPPPSYALFADPGPGPSPSPSPAGPPKPLMAAPPSIDVFSAEELASSSDRGASDEGLMRRATPLLVLPTTAPAPENAPAFLVEPMVIDLQDVAIGVPVEARFAITALEAVRFVLLQEREMEVRLKFDPINGQLEKGESATVRLSCVVPPGAVPPNRPQRFRFTVQNVANKRSRLEVAVGLRVVRPNPLHFPKLEAGVLDFGLCYVGEAFHKVKKVHITNMADEVVDIRVTTNSPLQLAVFEDPGLITPVRAFCLPARSTVCLHARLTYRLGAEMVDSGSCRWALMGLTFEVFEHNKPLQPPLHRHTLRVTAVVGCSLLRVSDQVVMLGCMQQVGRSAKGTFSLTNASPALPLEWAIVKEAAPPTPGPDAPPASVLHRSSSCTTRLGATSSTSGFTLRSNSAQALEMLELEADAAIMSLSRHSGTLQPEQSVEVQYEVLGLSYGLLEQTFCVRNLSNPMQPALPVSFQLFIDPQWLRLAPDAPVSRTDSDPDTEPDEVLIDNIPVVVQDGQVVIPPLRFKVPPTLCLTSTVDRGLTLRPTSRLDITVSDSLADVLAPDEADWAKPYCGPPIQLGPFGRATLYVWINKAPALTVPQLAALREWRKVRVEASLLLERLDISPQHLERHLRGSGRDAVKVIKLVFQLCQPELAVPEPVINVGKFGWFDGWKDKPFECVVRNRAEIPLCFTCTPSAADVAVSYPLPRTTSEELSYAAPLPSGDAWAQPDSPEGSLARSIETDAATAAPLAEEASAVSTSSALDVRVIPPFSSARICGCLLGQKFAALEVAKVERRLTIVNCHRPQNRVEVAIRAVLAQSVWRFEGLQDDAVVLPALAVPNSTTSVPADANLTIHCSATEAPVSCCFRLVIDPGLTDFLSMALLSFSSTAPIERFKFTATTSSVVLRVRSTAREGGGVPLHSREHLGLPPPPFNLGSLQQGTLTYDAVCHDLEAYKSAVSPLVRVATIVLEAEEQPNKEIPVLGTLMHNDTFSLSCRQLSLTKYRLEPKCIRFTGSFLVANLMVGQPLRFAVAAVAHSPADQLTITVDPSEASVEPNTSRSVRVTVVVWADGAPPDEALRKELVLVVQDVLHTNSLQTVAVTVSTMEGTSDREGDSATLDSPEDPGGLSPEGHQSPAEEEARPFEEAPLPSDATAPLRDTSTGRAPETAGAGCPTDGVGLRLHGCTRDGPDRYTINLGQVCQDSREGASWELNIENACPHATDYTIVAVRNSDREWVRLSRGQGTIAKRGDMQPVRLKFSLDRIGLHSKHLLLQNLSHVQDVKAIRVSMEVVARVTEQKAKAFFQVTVDQEKKGGEPKDKKKRRISYGDVFLGDRVTHRYLEISNVSDSPLEFALSSNPVSPIGASRIQFATSMSYTGSAGLSTIVVPAKSSSLVFVFYQPLPTAAHEPCTTADSFVQQTPVLHKAEVRVQCRVLKDYQETIALKARHLQPALSVSREEIVFPERDAAAPAEHTEQVAVHNLCPFPIPYFVRTDAGRFSVVTVLGADPLPADFTRRFTPVLLPEGATHRVVVTAAAPRAADRGRDMASLEDHLTIYNQLDVREKHYVCLRATVEAAPLPLRYVPNSHPYLRLEERVLQLVRAFQQALQPQLEQLTRAVRTHEAHYRADSDDEEDLPRPPFGSTLSLCSLRQPDDSGGGPGPAPPTTALPTLSTSPSIDPLAETSPTEERPPSVPDAAQLRPMASLPDLLKRPGTPQPHSCRGEVEDAFHAVLARPDVAQLYADFRYIMDELVYYGLHTHAGQCFRGLADLLFSALYSHPVFLLFGRGGDSGRRHPLYPSDLLRWEGQQRYFATFDVCFPLGL